jgi:ParB-like chromosome segregation protein Spo0J
MKIESVKISELRFAEYNPRTISKKQFKDLKKSLEEFGLVNPIVINSNEDRKNVIIGGHQRARAWEDLGNDYILTYAVDLPIEKEMKLNLRLNKNGGKFDDDLLLNYFDEEVLFEVGFTVNDLNINIDKYEDNTLEEVTKDVCECCGAPI